MLKALERIYRYRSFDGEFGMPGFVDAVSECQLYWTNPADFNDPFDCRPELVTSMTVSKRHKYAKASAKRVHGGVSRVERRLAAKHVNNLPLAEVRDRLILGYNQFIASSAVCCFSRSNESLLMWAHYSSSHRGYCLEFEECLEPYDFLSLPVIYQTERPKFKADGERGENSFEGALLTKSTEWKYEQEKRMIDVSRPAGKRVFPRQALKAVYLGCRISNAHKRNAIEIVSSKRSDILLYQAVESRSSFELEFRPVT